MGKDDDFKFTDTANIPQKHKRSTPYDTEIGKRGPGPVTIPEIHMGVGDGPEEKRLAEFLSRPEHSIERKTQPVTKSIARKVPLTRAIIDAKREAEGLPEHPDFKDIRARNSAAQEARRSKQRPTEPGPSK